MLIGSIVTDILDTIQSGIFWLLLKLDAIVYTFIDWIYQIILMLADGDLLSNSNLVDELVNRLYLIIGVIILFLVAYSLLRSMVNPDEALKGKESPVKIVQNVIISVVLIAVIPYVFNFAMGFQTSLLQQNTIGRLILGEGSGENASSSTIDDGGFNIAISVFQAFFQPNTSAGYCTGNASIDQNYPDCEDLVAEIGAYNNFEKWWANDVIASKNLFAISEANTLVAQNKISYTFIISTLAGAFVVFVLASYCIDIAIRLVKLAVFQLIAPLPILARIVPNEQTKKIFSNWLKATISTYVEVFIRLGILFFAVFIIDLVVANFNTIFNTMGNNLGNVNPVLVLIAQALVILGIILFVKQLPGIIKDITGLDGGKYNVFGSAMRGLSSIGALGTGAVRGFTTGFDKEHIPSSIGRGLKNAFAGGAKSFTGAAQKEYKGIGDIKKNTHASVEEVINRQRQRQANKDAQKRDLQAYRDTMTQGEHEPDFIYKVRKTKAGSSIAKKGRETAAGIKEWAGVSGSDSTTDNRTKEAINAIGSLVGSMQDVWKKDPGFIKAKEEANNAEALFNAVNKDYQEMLDKGVSATDAEQQILQKYQMSKEEAKRRMDVTKSIQKSQERTLQTSASKVNQIAGKIVELQKTQDRYGDVDIVRNIQSALEIQISDEAERNRIMQSVKSYGDLSDVRNYDRFITDLKNGNQSAIDVLEAYDKLDITGKRELTNISGREIERQNNQKKKDEK